MEYVDSILLHQGWEASRTCNIILLKGKGRAFCAGGDVVGTDALFCTTTIDLMRDTRNGEARSGSRKAA